MLSNLIQYYRECYLADNRSLSINNFFGSKVSARRFFDGREELLGGDMSFYPLPDDYGAELEKELKWYEKEMELLYCSLFLVGTDVASEEKSRQIVAPILIFQAQVEKTSEGYVVKLDHATLRVNLPVLAPLIDDELLKNVFFEELSKRFIPGPVQEGMISLFSQLASKYLPAVDTEELLSYPQLISERKLKGIVKSLEENPERNWAFVPASALGLVRKSADTMGIINELNDITSRNLFSPPIRQIFGGESLHFQPQKTGRVPAVLSQAQQRIIAGASKHAVQLVVGPPGTGKSFTIAALAIERMSMGKSVLIACRTDQAVDVIADKIERQLGISGVIVRGGRSTYLKDLKEHLKNILNSVFPHAAVDRKAVNSHEKQLSKQEKTLQHIETAFMKRVERENRRGTFYARYNRSTGLFHRLRRSFIGWSNRRSRPMWELMNDMEFVSAQLKESGAEYIKERYALQLKDTLASKRKELAGFLRAISARTGSQQEQYFANIDFSVILKTFPVWLVKISDIYKVLPLVQELFDVGIVDEATQCDIAGIIPIASRCKSMVFAGDPNQLRHVSFLSGARQAIMQQKYSIEHLSPWLLDYRNHSILDLVSECVGQQEQVVFLDEHFRSKPAIIAFSNKHFYSNALRVMTSKPELPPNDGLELCFLEGTRRKSGENEAEASLILQKVREIVDQEAGLDARYCSGIGILSPFRAQVDYLVDTMSKQFRIEEAERHRILIGTAYSFQGEERDIMFISFAVDGASHASAYIHLNKPDVFNVSITRARNLQYLCYSVKPEGLAAGSLFRAYLEAALEQRAHKAQPAEVKDAFCDSVKDALIGKEFTVYEAFHIAGTDVDLIARREHRYLGIDLIGYPGRYADAFQIERYKMLNRAGLRVLPLPYTLWETEKEKCVAEITALLAE